MKANRNNRRMNFESMEKRELFAADLGMDLAMSVEPAPAMRPAEMDVAEVGTADAEGKPVCYLKYKLERAFIKSWSTSGDADDRPTEEVAFYYNKIAFAYAATVDGGVSELVIMLNTQDGQDGADLLLINNGDGSDPMGTSANSSEDAFFVKVDLDSSSGDVEGRRWFVADSFSFGVEREMKESGEKGGTADINIGIGELQECTISKSMDSASPKLAQFAINGNSPGQCEIDFVEVGGGSAEGGVVDGQDFTIWRNAMTKSRPAASSAVDEVFAGADQARGYELKDVIVTSYSFHGTAH